MPIVRVALDVPLNILFDYLAPDIEITAQDIGRRVRVPFGRNTKTGLIMEVTTHSSVDPVKLKHITHIFRDIPSLPPALLDLFHFCSEYYHHPLGEVVMNGRRPDCAAINLLRKIFHLHFHDRLTAAGRARRHLSDSGPQYRQTKTFSKTERIGCDDQQ